MKEQQRQLLDVNKIVGGNIVKYRKAAGLTQEELAKNLRLTRSALSNIEHARYSADLNDLAEIAYELKIPFVYLFEGAQHEDNDLLYTKLEREHKFLLQKHQDLVSKMWDVLKRNS